MAQTDPKAASHDLLANPPTMYSVTMAKRYDLSDMQALATSRGGTCLSPSYEGMNKHLLWQCALGHQWLAIPSSVRQGHWCSACYGNARPTHEELQTLAGSRGGTFVASADGESAGKSIWRCANGHTWEAKASSIKRGSWCPHCAGSARLTLAHAHDAAHIRGGQCLSTTYANARTPLEWKCAKGHTWHATLGKIRDGQWCPYCRRTEAADRLRLTLEDVQARAQAKGGRCLATAYGGTAGIPLEFECAEKHRWFASPNSISRTWCPYCAGKVVTYAEMQELAKTRGGSVVSEKYEGDAVPIRWRCAVGHQWDARPGAIKRGSWCPQCSAGLGERLCRAAFESLFGVSFPSSFPLWLRPQPRVKWQLDGYNEPLGIAFEHHGAYHYHVDGRFSKSEHDVHERQRVDDLKAQLCGGYGVKLFTVPEIPTLLPLDQVVPYILEAAKRAGLTVPYPDKLPDWGQAFSPRDPLEKYRRLAEEQGGKLLSDHFMGSATNHRWQCKHKHEWLARPNSIQQGSWCPYCSGSRLSEGVRNSKHAEMHRAAAQRGGRCLAITYPNGNAKVQWQCAEGHVWQATVRNVLVNGSWCPTCYSNRRKRVA